MSDPDTSGTLRFLTDELQAAEDAHQRAYIIGHVPTGWSGSNGLPNPTDLFYQIVDRFSPHVVANVFFGHDHEDQHSIYYANKCVFGVVTSSRGTRSDERFVYFSATNISEATAQAVSWIGPSVTPLTNLNSGFRVYEFTLPLHPLSPIRADVLFAQSRRRDVRRNRCLHLLCQRQRFRFARWTASEGTDV